ncbi:MAG: hypothetical protein ACRC9L_08615 [Brevinema sp.]
MKALDFITNFFSKLPVKHTIFVVLSTQLLYLAVHLQFLLGMPQAGLALVDSLFFLFVGASIYMLVNQNKIQYFLGIGVVFFPIGVIQYFYIKIFNKPFLFSELSKFPTLIEVSPINLKISYTLSSALLIGIFIYILFVSIRNWLTAPLIKKIIPIVIISYYSFYMMEIIPKSKWVADPTTTFFTKGILKTIKSEIPDMTTEFSAEDVIRSFSLLRKKEELRSIYPISESPHTVPSKKRPIFMLVFESFYDYKHFLPLFEEDPFPKEYRELVGKNNYTGPNQSTGSFDARFVSLTGSVPFQPTYNKFLEYQTLPSILRSYGYETTALESVNPTYNLVTYYKLWGFDNVFFQLFGNDWTGVRLDPNTYEKNITKIISDTPDDVTPFYFGFTYLGHGGSEEFTDKLPDPTADISSYLALYSGKDQQIAKKLLKANIFNAERILSIKNMILEKYPDALIVIKSDHYSSGLYQSFNRTNMVPAEYKNYFMSDPHVLPFIVINGRKGSMPLKEGFAPENIPLLILAESGLPYANTTASLLFRDIPDNKTIILNNIYKKENDRYLAIALSQELYPDLWKYKNATEIISQDLYRNKKLSLTLELLEKNTKP